MDIQEYIKRSKLKYKYASQDGFILGLYFGIIYILTAFFPNPTVGLINLLSYIATPFICYYFAKRFRDEVWEGGIRFHQALGFGIYLFFFASLIMSVFLYVDLEFFHPNIMTDSLNANMQLLEEYSSSKDQFQDQMNIINSFSNIDWTLSIIFSSLFSGFILFLILSPILVFTGKKTEKIRITVNPQGQNKKENNNKTENDDDKKSLNK